MATDLTREHRHMAVENVHAKKSAARPAHKRRSHWLLLGLAVLAAVVWLLPSIVAHTPLLQWGLHLATAQLNGSVAVESASLGWFSPVALRGVEVKDSQGKPVLSVPAASGDRTLAGLLCNYANLGRFRLESPKLSLVLRDDGSNLEDLLAKYVAPKAEQPKSTAPAKIGLSLDVVDASLSVTDQHTGQSWQVEKLAASVEMPEGAQGPLAAKLSADLPDAQRSGKLIVGVKMAGGAGQATVSAVGWPLAMFRAAAARFAPGTTCDGRLSSELTASWGTQAGAKNGIEAKLSTEALSLRTPALQTDVVRLDRFQAVCQASWQADCLEIQRSSIDCDVGYASLSSTLRWAEKGGQPPFAGTAQGVLRTNGDCPLFSQKDAMSLDWLLHQRHDLSGRVDLARLARLLPATLRLRRQVEINSGQVQLALGSRPGQQGMTWHGQLGADNLTATASGRKIAWQNPPSFLLDAHETPAGPVVDGLRCESDFLKIHASGTPDALAASLSFNLKQLSDQLAQFVDLGALQLAGEGSGNLNWKRSPQQLFTLRLTSVPLVLASPWLNLNEPQLDITATGAWNQAQRRLQIEPAQLTCATAAIQASNIVVALPDKGPMELGGTVKYQGDVARIRKWLTDPAKPPTWQLSGNLTGTAELHHSAGVIRGETTADVANLTVVDASGKPFQEPRVRLTARGDYNSQTGVVQLEQCQLASSVLAAGAAGRIAPAGGVNSADVKADLNYDMDRLAAMLRPYLGAGVQMAGRGSSAAFYRGPFSLANGQSAASLKWDGANVYGLQIGPGEMKATMANGGVAIEPLDLAVSRGHMRLAPSVRLTPSPIELSLPKGPLAQRIEIDPVLCATMLKYIAPVLADVATAQGAFSIDLEGCRIPLGDLANGEVAGRFTVHTVEVGAGPLVRELAVFLGRETPAKLRQESVVLFRLVGGRMYHQGLELMFPNFTIRTYGSVGLDQTMAIMAEMPVPPQWLEKSPMLAKSLPNQTIRVPIAGTLSKPQVDKKVMQDLTRQFMQNAAQNVLQGEVGKQLDRFFGPKK